MVIDPLRAPDGGSAAESHWQIEWYVAVLHVASMAESPSNAMHW